MTPKQAQYLYLRTMKDDAVAKLQDAPNTATKLAWRLTINFIDRHMIELETTMIEEQRTMNMSHD